MKISYKAKVCCASLLDYAQSGGSSESDDSVVVEGLATLHPTKLNGIANMKFSQGGQPLILQKDFPGAFSMILQEARRFGKPFCYDDIIPFLKEKHDWLPKESVLERYVRKLCEYNLLFRVGKGVYVVNEVSQ